MCVIRFFFFNDTATTEIYTLSLHDALPIYVPGRVEDVDAVLREAVVHPFPEAGGGGGGDRDAALLFLLRSEEHTSELQSQSNLVCRLLLEKKKKDDLLQRSKDYSYERFFNC